jgi:2-polyprenyl-3-methyl-5-hydroxy-6-metoxy-1,4-benzoquinol methylase
MIKSLDQAVEEMVARGMSAKDLISKQKPELLELFLTYQNEAIEARKFLHSNLVKLDMQAEILEVGGGILALSIQLASEGFQMTTVEPVGEGFTGISHIMDIFLQISRNEKLRIELIRQPIEESELKDNFDFIFSINVLEHLRNPYSVIVQLVRNLKKDGTCRIFSPNYDFPYEPHFQKWMYQRRNRAFYLPLSNAKSDIIEISEWHAVHRSLNFITLRKLEEFLLENKIMYSVNQEASQNLVLRAAYDQELKNRHKVLASTMKVLIQLRLIAILGLLPKSSWPIIDIEVLH